MLDISADTLPPSLALLLVNDIEQSPLKVIYDFLSLTAPPISALLSSNTTTALSSNMHIFVKHY